MKYIKEFKEQLNDNFYKWFGDSKMVDNQGKPQVYYHGSKHNFDTFEDDLIGMATGNEGHYGRGFYFTDKERSAEIWADPYKSGDGITVLSVYLRIDNPFTVSTESLYNIGKKYDLDVDEKEEIAIDLEKIHTQLKDIDPVSAELLRDIIDNDWKKGWKVFLSKHDGVPESKLDLNDVSDWVEYGIGNDIKEVPYYIIEELDGLGITDYLEYGHKREIQMHYLTELGQNAKVWSDAIKKEGYDGIIAGDEIVVFKPNQIKSTHNKGSFNPNNDNINENLI